jgi:hydrogenase maturation factor
MKLPPGKIPVELLNNIVFKNLGVTRDDIIVGPKNGLDGAVLELGDKNIIVSMDPVTGAIEKIGWLAVNVNANDVATFGVEPSFMFSCILLPENSDSELIRDISSQINNAAKEIGIAVVGGHCESTIGLNNPVVVGCIIGFTDKKKFVTAANAKPGDIIILTKSAGIEGTAILASDKEKELNKKIHISQIVKARNFYREISVVKEALIAYETGGVNAMHDPTEGGIIGGIHEMADASKLGVKIFKKKIPVRIETSLICKFFKIDPLQLISSGALLISANPKYVYNILNSLSKEGIQATVIGEFLSNPNLRVIKFENEEERDLIRPKSDHLWKALRL